MDPVTAAILIAAAAKGIAKLFANMSYNEFINARDSALNDLKKYGATEPDWSYELQQGFTHDQIKRTILALKDYTPTYQKFLEIVYYPVLFKVNPTEFENQLKKVAANGGIDVPGAKNDIKKLNVDVSNVTPKTAEASFTPSTKVMVVSVGAIAVLGLVSWLLSDDDKKKKS
jgi:hypothetical protein